MASITITDDQIKSTVKEYAKELGLVPADDMRGKKLKLDKVREDYFCNHPITWIRNMIFDRYPETWAVNGGWAINPSGKEPGIRGTYVKFAQMKKWLAEHDDEIDWHEQLAK